MELTEENWEEYLGKEKMGRKIIMVFRKRRKWGEEKLEGGEGGNERKEEIERRKQGGKGGRFCETQNGSRSKFPDQY